MSECGCSLHLNSVLRAGLLFFCWRFTFYKIFHYCYDLSLVQVVFCVLVDGMYTLLAVMLKVQ